MKKEVIENGAMNDFHGYYDGIDYAGVIGSLFGCLHEQGTVKLNSEIDDILKGMWNDGFLVLPKSCFEKIVQGLLLADEMRETQKDFFRKRKVEGTPFPSKETKLILKLSKEKEAALDELLAELKKEVGDGV